MKIAIVTGASSGMGREFVKQIPELYRSLNEIWVIARRRERLRELQKTSKVKIRIIEGDLLKRDVYAELRYQLEENKPDIRMLVNAAGFGKSGTVESILEEDQRLQLSMIDLNCMALSRMIFYCLPYMKSGSRIVNLASAAAFCPQPGFSVYAATKSYVLSFSKSLGRELKKKGIVVTAVCPGPVDTEFFDHSGSIQSNLKKLTMASAGKVVKQALCDSRARKTVSVYGCMMKASRILSKCIPDSLIMRIAFGKEQN